MPLWVVGWVRWGLQVRQRASEGASCVPGWGRPVLHIGKRSWGWKPDIFPFQLLSADLVRDSLSLQSRQRHGVFPVSSFTTLQW